MCRGFKINKRIFMKGFSLMIFYFSKVNIKKDSILQKKGFSIRKRTFKYAYNHISYLLDFLFI